MKKSKQLTLLGCFLLALFCACTTTEDPANQVVAYLNALVNHDANSAVALSCSDWEDKAKLEADSFLSVGTSLNNVKCQTVRFDDMTAEVSCNGTIEMTYDNEIRSIDLSLRKYSLKKQAGAWLVCGYQ